MTVALSLLVTVATQQPQQDGGMLQQHRNDCIVEMREMFCFALSYGGEWGWKRCYSFSPSPLDASLMRENFCIVVNY